MTFLRCFLFGHIPHRLNSTFYIVCLRCDATLNFRVSTRRPS